MVAVQGMLADQRQALEKQAKRASVSVLNGEKLGQALRDSMDTLIADVAAAVSPDLDMWRRDLSAEVVPLRGGTREAVLCVMHQLPGTAEGETLADYVSAHSLSIDDRSKNISPNLRDPDIFPGIQPTTRPRGTSTPRPTPVLLSSPRTSSCARADPRTA